MSLARSYSARPVLLLSAALTLLAGCAAQPPALQMQKSYSAEWIGARPLIDNSHLSLTLGDDGRAYGNAGCNHWFAGYILKGPKLSFNPPGSTRKLCAPAVMEQEQRFLQALGNVERWDEGPNGQIRFWPASGQPLRFWPEEG